ncbi:hypothetical protein FB107DRAFT_279753 [Schizophyllum commune]
MRRAAGDWFFSDARRTFPRGLHPPEEEEALKYSTLYPSVLEEHDTLDNAFLRSLLSEMTPRMSMHTQPPINRLPNEILCAIFFICGDPSPTSIYPRDAEMHAYDMEATRAHQYYSKSAVILGRVCARWYAVTRSFPALWTTVDVIYPTRAATSILKLCLKYSAGLPLALWISNCFKLDARQNRIDPRFMSLVAGYAHRWRDISIELTNGGVDVLKPLNMLSSGAFKALERARIDIYASNTKENTADTHLWNLFFTSPKLSCADLVRKEYIRSGLALAPLQQLTSIGLHCTEPAMISPILSTCTNLEHLYIKADVMHLGPGSVTPSMPSAVHLPRLRVLMLCGMINWTPLFTALTAPAIDRLDMSHMRIPHRHIESMLLRSSAHIKMLAVYWPASGQADGFPALLRSSTLQGLRILRFRVDPERGPGGVWENQFDPQPYLPPRALFTKNATEAQRWYLRLCDSTL